MSSPTLAYSSPTANTHDIRLGWLALGAAVLTLHPMVNLAWRWIVRPFLLGRGPMSNGFSLGIDLIPAVAGAITVCAGAALFTMVSRRRPPATGVRWKAFLLLALAALYGLFNVAGSATMRYAIYKYSLRAPFPSFQVVLATGNVMSWLGAGIMALLLIAAIFFLLHAGHKSGRRPLAIVGACGIGLELLVFLCFFALATAYTAMTVIGTPWPWLLKSYSKVVDVLYPATAVVNLLAWPTIALLARPRP